MNLKKGIISVLLFLTYFVGLAHNVIPHCHTEDVLSHNLVEDEIDHHHHDHHSHSTKNTADHQHIVHDDHLDGNILDLVLCIFNEVEHTTANNHDHYITSNTEISVKRAFIFIPLFSMLEDSTSEIKSNLNSYQQPCESFSYLLVDPSTSPLRGPPVYSC